MMLFMTLPTESEPAMSLEKVHAVGALRVIVMSVSLTILIRRHFQDSDFTYKVRIAGLFCRSSMNRVRKSFLCSIFLLI